MRKINRNLLVLLFAAGGLTLTACDQAERADFRGDLKHETSVATTVVHDAAVTTKVKAAMLADDNVKGLGISVTTQDGVVTLQGKAATSAERDEAVKIAQNVEGVKRVEDQIEIGGTHA
jgi:hyperosmotically inducible protein